MKIQLKDLDLKMCLLSTAIKKIKRIMMPLASKKIRDEYEERRRKFSDSVNQELVDEAKEDTSQDVPLPPNYQNIIDGIVAGKTKDIIAIEGDMSIPNIDMTMKRMKEKGYGFKLAMKANYIYYPDTKKWETYPKQKV